MKQNNLKHMKKILDILYKDKPIEQHPTKCVIKLQSTVTPQEQLSLNEWKAQYNVGIDVKDRTPIHNANEMMSMWTGAKKSIIG
jgi:hypothetical protein